MSTIRIKIGTGANGPIFADLDKVKACNFCRHFKGYGLHAHSGHCFRLCKDIDGGYIGNYGKTAKSCENFEVRTELLEENDK